MRRSISRMVVASMLGVAMLSVAVAPASAKDGDVERRGACSGRSDWKLKLSEENGAIEVEYEVDQNVVGRAWSVRIRRDGNLVFSDGRRTRSPSGSFEVRFVRPDRRGDDVFTARAVARSSGEVCGGRAVWTR